MYFTTVDSLQGYRQIELTEEDRYLTTLAIPYGHYFYCPLPMGCATTWYPYCYCGVLALQAVTKCVKVVDDVLLFDNDLTLHYRWVLKLFTCYLTHGIILNRDRTASKVNFSAYALSSEEIATDPYRAVALRNILKPANITDALFTEVGEHSTTTLTSTKPQILVYMVFRPRPGFLESWASSVYPTYSPLLHAVWLTFLDRHQDKLCHHRAGDINQLGS